MDAACLGTKPVDFMDKRTRKQWLNTGRVVVLSRA